MSKGRVVEMEVAGCEDVAAIRAIIEKTNKENPKPEDISRLKKMLQESPGLWRVAGDFSEHALWKITEDIDGTPFIIESVRTGIEKLKGDLGYADAPPLEKMLINQIALCWLRLNMLERTHWVKTYENHSTETGLYWDRRLLTAQRRFTRACETLARVRKLSRYTPALQVNIAAEGGQQVNVNQ
jgi:hypothetical protein